MLLSIFFLNAKVPTKWYDDNGIEAHFHPYEEDHALILEGELTNDVSLLAAKYPFHRPTYTKSNEPFIQSIIEKARKEIHSKGRSETHAINYF